MYFYLLFWTNSTKVVSFWTFNLRHNTKYHLQDDEKKTLHIHSTAVSHKIKSFLNKSKFQCKIEHLCHLLFILWLRLFTTVPKFKYIVFVAVNFILCFVSIYICMFVYFLALCVFINIHMGCKSKFRMQKSRKGQRRSFLTNCLLEAK